MGVEVAYLEDRIRVKYVGHVDGYDIAQQIDDEFFLDELSQKKRIVYDYTAATAVNINEEDISRFAALGRLYGDLLDTVKVAVLVNSEKGVRKAEAYKAGTESSRWQVNICLTESEVDSFLTS